MKVYIVKYDSYSDRGGFDSYSSHWIERVFLSEEKARKYAEELKKKNYDKSYYVVELKVEEQ